MTLALMIQGTGSDVGKSLIVAGLARAFTRRGVRVRPFKPQNMSNNAAVTADGGEIGRAQALQARAAGVAPSVHMNPVLLKPQSDIGAQIVVQGRMIGTAKARDYQSWKPKLLASVLESFEHLRSQADIVLVEGAGSPAEINLRANDIANMGFARATGTPVVLVGDIDRGGVIASLVGTKTVLDPADAAMIRGFIVNRFRGDPTLFADGMTMIADATGWAPIGLVPHFPDAAQLPAEDALALDARPVAGDGRPQVTIAVLVFPHIANFDDVDPLRQEPEIAVNWVRPGEPIPAQANLVVLPGSKTTIDDLRFLRKQGWDVDLGAHIRRGGRVLGLCGGFQMLGRTIADPHGIEGEPCHVDGLGLLEIETVMTSRKQLVAVSGLSCADSEPFRGYEMHVGETTGPDCARPLLRFIDGTVDGAVSADGRVCGTYVHGLFADDRQRASWLRRLGVRAVGYDYEARIEGILDRFAEHLERHLDCDSLLTLSREVAQKPT